MINNLNKKIENSNDTQPLHNENSVNTLASIMLDEYEYMDSDTSSVAQQGVMMAIVCLQLSEIEVEGMSKKLNIDFDITKQECYELYNHISSEPMSLKIDLGVDDSSPLSKRAIALSAWSIGFVSVLMHHNDIKHKTRTSVNSSDSISNEAAEFFFNLGSMMEGMAALEENDDNEEDFFEILSATQMYAIDIFLDNNKS